MISPIKLSPERWDMLRYAANPTAPSLWSVVLDKPLETQDVIFLAGEYVPAESRASSGSVTGLYRDFA